jgi:uroporphyrin-3 C-methyltransferase/uroporphyrinogen III methyltransferase/synthase
MNDLLPPAQPASQSHSAQPAQSNEAGRSAGGRDGRLPAPQRLIAIGFAVLALLLAAQWWSSYSEVKNLRREMAQRLQSGDSLNSETRILVKSVLEGMKELQAKVAVLEGKQQEAQSQQIALEQLYQDLSKNRDDWALSEIEQVLSTASQQLQLAGNVRGALIALQNADARLSRSDKPQFITIRRALARDQERLKALPSVDLTGIALRLDSIISQIDGMPLLSDEKPAAPVAVPRNTRRPIARELAGTGAGDAANARGNANADWIMRLQDTWYGWTGEMWSEVKQLIRVRSVNTSDALLLSPTQAYYARENLKLRLLNARLALLSRNEPAFRSDLLAAQDAIAKYFDTRARPTQTAQALLKQVQASNLSIEMPTLAESLNAVRNYKAKP